MAGMAPSRTPRRAAPDPRLSALAEESGYEILGRIGTGGMGIVYRAHDADGNDVAIKLLRHEISEDARARDRLAREVTAQQLVRNENIVRILDAELDSTEAFVVTEFIPGPTLEEAVRTHGGLHPEAVREIGLTMGETLRAIHEAGVIHRDLKPSNVMLRGATEADLAGFDPDGDRLDPVIIDFGIAIAAEESRLTSTGLVMGTAAYLDPEVIRTDHSGAAGDWWAWAALLSFAATGREPYGAGRADLVFLRAERGELDIDGVPTELGQWLRSALQSDPTKRPDPEEMLERLAALDLTRYDDPGETELLQAGSGEAETTALPVSDSVERTAVLPVVGPEESEAPAAAPASGATAPIDQPTEALPRIDTPSEPVTEALPVSGAPTMALPTVPPLREPGPSTAPPLQAPQRAAQPYPPQPYPPQPYAPQSYPSRPDGAQPYPPQSYPQQPYSTHSPVQQAPNAQQALIAQQQWDPAHGAAWPEPPPRRPLLVWLGHLLIVALAAVAPSMSLLALLLLGTAARTWERTHRSVSARRLRGATGAGPAWQAGLASPFRAVLGLLEIALQALFPLILGLLVGIAVDAGWTLLGGAPPPDGVVFALAMAITLLITWTGLGSRTTRNGAHRMMDAAAPDRLWGGVVLVLLLLLLGAVLTTVLAREGMVDYFPFSGGPRLEDIAVWRP